jgi:pyruvate/2-oxoglutarate dehydrogenase complex dihydrolipoamide acyltransferase (E2) component
MPKIRMLMTAQGSPDGFTICLYEQGKEYEVSKALAQNFVFQQGIAEPVPTLQRRAVSVAPDNKAVPSAPENKSAVSMRVFQLANQLGITSGEVREIAKRLRIVAKAPSSVLSVEDVRRITAEVSG